MLHNVTKGMSERERAEPQEHIKDSGRHDHSDNQDVADVVLDEEHLTDDLGGIYTEKEIEAMDVNEKVNYRIYIFHNISLFLGW